MKTIKNIQTSSHVTCDEFQAFLAGAMAIIGGHVGESTITGLLTDAVLNGNMIPMGASRECRNEISAFIGRFSGGGVAGCHREALKKAWPPSPSPADAKASALADAVIKSAQAAAMLRDDIHEAHSQACYSNPVAAIQLLDDLKVAADLATRLQQLANALNS